MRVIPCKRRIRLAALALGMLIAGMPLARAFPSLVTLHGVTFSDGGTASGEFALNVSGFLNNPTSIVTTAGAVLGGSTYDLTGPFSKTATTVDLTLLSPPAPHAYQEGLHLVFAFPLGSVEYDPIVTGVSCEYTLYSCSGSGFRDVVAGYAELAEPASLAVFGGALFGLGTMRQRFRRRSVGSPPDRN